MLLVSFRGAGGPLKQYVVECRGRSPQLYVVLGPWALAPVGGPGPLLSVSCLRGLRPLVSNLLVKICGSKS